MEIVAQIIGGLILFGITAVIFYQLNYREPVVPGYLDEWDMMADFEPDTRSLEERIEEQRRLLKFQNLID